MRVPPRTWRRSIGSLALATVVAGCQSEPTPPIATGTGNPAAPTATTEPSPPAAASPTGSTDPGLTADEVFRQVSPAVAFVQTEIGTGSGFLIDDRHVVTNAHVVRPYQAATVILEDRTKAVDAPVIAWDLLADLAVLELPSATALPTLPLADGSTPPTGTRVYLVGYPLADATAPTATITEGIISSAAFEWVDALSYHQTDAVIDFGQSGGVLVDGDGRLLGVTGGSRGRFAVALDGADALARVGRLLAGEDVDAMDDRVLPAPTRDGPKTIDITFQHRADMHAWLVPGAEGDPKVRVSSTSDRDINMVALAAAGKLSHRAGPPAGKLAVDIAFDAPGPYLVAVEPDQATPVKVHLISTAALTHFDDPDDGQALVRDRPRMGAADYAGDIDWYTLQLAAGKSVRVRASAAALDPALFVDQVGSTGAPLAGGRDSGGPLGGDDEVVFKAPSAGEYLVVVSDLRFTGAGAYRLTVSAG